jgi:hypothetical protein
VSAVPFAVLLVTLVLGSGAWVAGRLARGRVPAPAVTAIAGCGTTVVAVARWADGAAFARGLRRLDGGRPRGRLRRLVSPHPAPGERARHLAERRRRSTGPP